MATAHELPLIPQLIPSQTCLACRVCCHFPDRSSALRPYFTPDDIRVAVGLGIAPAVFPAMGGGRIEVVPNPHGEGFLCPAYDPATSHCRIYDRRPLDCRLYPLALMWNRQGDTVMLGWDTTCPFVCSPALRDDYLARMTAMLESEYLDTVAESPQLIGRYQPEVVAARPLPALTARLAAARASSLPRAFTLSDRLRLEAAAATVDTDLAAVAFPAQFVWTELLPYTWTELAGCFCLFADSPDGRFMPLPPLGPASQVQAAATEAFAAMRRWNPRPSVSRIENIPHSLAALFEEGGWALAEKDPDYVYDAGRLAALAGDAYRSQRHAINLLERSHRVAYAPYVGGDRESCLELHLRWMRQQEARGLEAVAAHLLKDSASAHQVALRDHAAMGLTGRVVRVDGSMAAYTFGYPRSASTLCVLLEVADRSIPGLAAHLFREFCREAVTWGYTRINTMDDSGLSALAQAKRAYHPVELVKSFIATER